LCNAGYYGPGGGSCRACPANTNSAAGSDAVTDCLCNAGYTASSDGMACSACPADTYKANAGTGSCSACPDHMVSAPGSDSLSDCTCKEGYSKSSEALCGATDVSREVSTKTLAVTLLMSASEFNSQMSRIYRWGCEGPQG